MTSTDFNTVIQYHTDFLRPFAVSLTHNSEDAKDLFQETLLRALLYRDKYQFGTNLKAWLYTIMRNIFINNYRKNKRFTKVSNEAPSDLQQYETGKAAYNEGWNQMRMQEIKKAIDALPKPLQFSFELYYAGYKYQEIADITKEPMWISNLQKPFEIGLLIWGPWIPSYMHLA